MENVACVCVSSVFVVGLCVGNDAIYLNTCSGLHEPSFSQGPRRRKISDTY